MRTVVSMVLESMGISNVVETTDGSEAVDVLRRSYYDKTVSTQGFDLVISDWKMPYKSGLELLKEIRCNPRLRHLPYVMLTCLDDEESIKEALEAGATKYLTKPFSTKTLRGTIRSLLHDIPQDEESSDSAKPLTGMDF
jgi:two-component system chemotaxis response regulator CheY